MAQMQEEMSTKFTKKDELKFKYDKEMERLGLIKRFLAAYRNGLDKQVAYQQMKHNTKKNQILQSDIYNKLNDIEKKLINNESQIYAIQQYIETKGAEANYQHQFTDSMQLISDINMDLIKRCMSMS